MRFRWVQMLVLLAIAAAAFAGVAQALDFDDEDPEPPHAEVGMVYSYEIGTHAGCLPHRLEVRAGSLPPGLAIRRIDLDTHVVEGVATEPGSFSAWIHLLDCDNKSAETLFTFDVWTRRWGIATQSLRAAGLGAPYSATLEGSGLPSNVTWEVTSGALPAGLTLSSAGVISGTPTALGSSTFTVKATANEINFGPTRIDSKTYTLNVVSLAASASRSVGEVGIRFNTTLVASGGQSPYTWSAKSGVPAGLSIGPNGAVTGRPTRAGSYPVVVQVTDANGTTSDVEVRLIIRARLAIASKSLPVASAGRAYRAKVAARGGVEGKRWAITRGALPRGLKLGAISGAITGVPTTAASYRLTVRVRDALGAVSTKALVLNVH